ncbi:MAG: DUF1634 domain-containing protein [Methylophilus sp.]|jgi:uncharacterized membrane protein
MKNLELMIGKALFFCVLFSIGIVVVGAVMYCAQHSHDVVNFTVVSGNDYLDLHGLWQKVWQGDALSIIQLGLLAIIASQVVRVFLTALIFVKQKDWTFMALSLIVLFLMSYQLL